MAQVPSDPVDMRRAFRRHLATANTVGVPRRTRVMSMFYAAECGLKYLFMKDGNVSSTIDLRAQLATHLGTQRKTIEMHDLEQLCVAVSVLQADVGVPPASFQVSGQSFAAYKIHEAARYGVKLPAAYIGVVEGWLRNVNTVVHDRITQQGP